MENNSNSNENKNSVNKTMKQMAKTVSNGNQLFSTKNLIILVLVLLLILSFLGINLLVYVGRFLELLVNIVRPLVDGLIGFVFYYIGLAINVSADVTADVARTGIDIAEGTAHSVGNLLQNEDNVSGPLPEQNIVYKQLFETQPLEEQPIPYTMDIHQSHNDASEIWKTTTDMAEMIMQESSLPLDITVTEKKDKMPSISMAKDLDETIQKEKRPTVTNEQPYCFVGEFEGKRSCISLEENETCESNQTYKSEQECLQKPEPPQQQPVRRNWGIAPPVPPRAAYSPPMGNYLPQDKYVMGQPKYYTNMMNPYYASENYRMTNPNTMGPNPGLYLQK